MFNTGELLRPYQEVFSEGLGALKGVTAKFYIDENIKPRYCKPRPIPLALRAKVEAELDRLKETGVIRPVEYPEWAAPIVPVPKSTGAIRICGDYKVIINQDVKVDKYPTPNINDLITKLTGDVMYTKLDLSHAYQQVVLDEVSRKLTTINTSKGLFEYERLPYGVRGQLISRHIPKNHGTIVTKHPDDRSLPGRRPGDGENARRARSQSRNCAKPTPRSRATLEKGEMYFSTEVMQVPGS